MISCFMLIISTDQIKLHVTTVPGFHTQCTAQSQWYLLYLNLSKAVLGYIGQKCVHNLQSLNLYTSILTLIKYTHFTTDFKFLHTTILHIAYLAFKKNSTKIYNGIKMF